jgi:predicted DNA-binding transcriptional regulator AlpA
MSKAGAQTELARLGLPPRGLSRDQSAAYVGLSAWSFDQMVAAGTMPSAKRLKGRVVWDRVQLDKAFDRLPNEAGTDTDHDDIWSRPAV